MLLVYTHKITPRLNYIFKHVCTRILSFPVSFTTQVEEFIAHEGHHGLTDKQLKEAYYLMCPKVKKSAEAKEIVESQLGSE